MRLNEKAREIIKFEASNQLGSDAVVRLFGSRADKTPGAAVILICW